MNEFIVFNTIVFVVFTQTLHALSTSNLKKICVFGRERFSLMLAEVCSAFRQLGYQARFCDAKVAAYAEVNEGSAMWWF